jgi:hypothetical protein
MTTRRAACSCGQLHLTIEGEPMRISMCHCFECQRRTGAVLSNQARFAGGHAPRTCVWRTRAKNRTSCPGYVAVAIGAFADRRQALQQRLPAESTPPSAPYRHR